MSVLLLVRSKQQYQVLCCHARLYIGACRKGVCSHAVESVTGVVRLQYDISFARPYTDHNGVHVDVTGVLTVHGKRKLQSREAYV